MVLAFSYCEGGRGGGEESTMNGGEEIQRRGGDMKAWRMGEGYFQNS